MARATWPLRQGCPAVRVVLTLVAGNQPLPLFLLADTGAGSNTARFELILEESDCLLCGGQPRAPIVLGGTYTGRYPLYQLRVQVPELGFDVPIHAVGVPARPPDFDGIAGFRFLNRFSYGNFGNPAEFGLET
jgi:hypothetical protein